MGRTDRIVFEHAQRLVGTWSLHGPIIACHGHRYQAHHNGTGLCCRVLSSAHVGEDVGVDCCIEGWPQQYGNVWGDGIVCEQERIPFFAIATGGDV
jgi:hypothetical protein